MYTSRGPSQTAKWFPVGERESEAMVDVGSGKCYLNDGLLVRTSPSFNEDGGVELTLTRRYASDASYTPRASFERCRSPRTK